MGERVIWSEILLNENQAACVQYFYAMMKTYYYIDDRKTQMKSQGTGQKVAARGIFGLAAKAEAVKG